MRQEIREESAAAHAETRRYIETTTNAMREEIREENATAHEETRRQIEETRQQIQVTAGTLRRELHEEIAAAHADTRLLFGATAEEMRHLVKNVADGVTLANEKIDRFDEKIERIAAGLDLRIIRLEVEISRR
jgi:F0F1-type ATP synthase membrane subunit b/b'